MKYFIPSKKTHPIFSRALSFLFISFLFCLYSPQGCSEESLAKRPTQGFWSVGNTVMFPGKVQIDKEGTVEYFNFNPTFSFGFEYPFRENLLIIPEFGLNFSGHGRHDSITRFTCFLSTDVGKRWKYFLIQTGVGLHWTFIDGPGGTEALNNGNSTTDFYVPEFTSISSNLTWTSALGFPLPFFLGSNPPTLKLDTAIYNPFDSLKRAISYRISLQFPFSVDSLNPLQ